MASRRVSGNGPLVLAGTLTSTLLMAADLYPPDRIRIETERATVVFEPGQLAPEAMERFARLVDRGIADITSVLGAHGDHSGRITYYVSSRIPMSRAFRRTVLLPMERVRTDSAPYLHETTHVLLPARSDCMWVGEGFASYLESYVSEHLGGYDGAVFAKGGNREVDRLARRYLASEQGRSVLAFVGSCGAPPDIEWERGRVAAPFYVLSQSLVKHMVDRSGLEAVIRVFESADLAFGVEQNTGRSLAAWKTEWLTSLGQSEAPPKRESAP
jgi:hypothetical protein